MPTRATKQNFSIENFEYVSFLPYVLLFRKVFRTSESKMRKFTIHYVKLSAYLNLPNSTFVVIYYTSSMTISIFLLELCVFTSCISILLFTLDPNSLLLSSVFRRTESSLAETLCKLNSYNGAYQ